jgi:predicted enzyme related to lactoylglutathione lyase
MINQIATVAIYVEDQQKSLEFWTEKAGFEVRRNQPMGPAGAWIELAPPGAQTCLVIYPRSMMPQWKELKPSIVFTCDNINETYERMSSKGVKFLEEPKSMAWGTYARFQDVDGNEFLLKS